MFLTNFSGKRKRNCARLAGDNEASGDLTGMTRMTAGADVNKKGTYFQLNLFPIPIAPKFVRNWTSIQLMYTIVSLLTLEISSNYLKSFLYILVLRFNNRWRCMSLKVL